MLMAATTISEPRTSWSLGNSPFSLSIHADLIEQKMHLFAIDHREESIPFRGAGGLVLSHKTLGLQPVEEAHHWIGVMARDTAVAQWRAQLREWLIDRYGVTTHVVQHDLRGYLDASSAWLTRSLLGTLQPEGSWQDYADLHLDPA